MTDAPGIDREAYARVQRIAREVPGYAQRSAAEFAASRAAFEAGRDPAADLYVFAYGSLIWNPLIAVSERIPATLGGWHRSFCTAILVGRASPEAPGLLLALDRGGSCRGVCLRVEAAAAADALDHLWQREMFGGSYDWRWVRARPLAAGAAAGGAEIKALAFVANRAHPRYRGAMDIDTTAMMIARARGELGSCREYLDRTLAGLAAFGIADRGLTRIAAAIARRDRAA